MSVPQPTRGRPYFAYGVALESEWPLDLPRLTVHDHALAHVHFARLAHRPQADDHASSEWFACETVAGGATQMRWGRLFRCVVSGDGRHVACEPLEEGSTAVLRNFLLAQILSYAVVRQGLEPIHAAVVDADGIGVAIVGDCTYGKSTLAAALVAGGHRLVADDLLLIDERAGWLRAQIGTGRIRLHDDSAAALLPETARGERLHPGSTKRSFAMPAASLARQPVGIRHMIVVQPPQVDRRGIIFEPLTCAQRFDALLRNSFNIRLLDDHRLERQFEFAARIAPRITGWALQYPRSLAAIGTVAAAVVDTVRGLRLPIAAGPLNEEVAECL